jgi:protein translocase SecG subunit
MLLNIEITVAVLLIIVVLLQNKNVSLNLSSMSGDMWEITKRGPEKIMQNTTIILAVAFIVNSILLFVSK